MHLSASGSQLAKNVVAERHMAPPDPWRLTGGSFVRTKMRMRGH